MLSLNFQRPRVRRAFSLAWPLLAAFGVHAVFIAVVSRADGNPPARSASDQPDNTRQLVRLSRLWVVGQPLAKASLSAVPSQPAKPPPPPQLTKPPKESSALGRADQQTNGQAQCTGQKPQGVAPLTLATVAALWSLGHAPDAEVETMPADIPIAEVRELPLAAFSGRAVKELDRLQIKGNEHTYQLWAKGDQVWALRRASP